MAAKSEMGFSQFNASTFAYLCRQKTVDTVKKLMMNLVECNVIHEECAWDAINCRFFRCWLTETDFRTKLFN